MKPRLWDRVARWFGYEPRPVGRRNIFAAAMQNRLTADWSATINTPNYELQGALPILRARARDLERNSPMVRRYLQLIAENVIGDVGIRLQCQNSSDHTNEKLEAAWCAWGRAESCSADGRQSWRALQALIVRSVARDGEAFVRLVRGGASGLMLQLIDPDQVDEGYNATESETGNVVRMGIEVDSYNRAVAYHVFRQHPGDYVARGRERVRIPASEILHLFLPRRAGQVRGESWMAPVLLPLRMLDGYLEAEVTAARTAAAKMGFIVQTNPEFAGEGPDPDAVGATSFEAAPGTVDRLAPGESFQSWDPSHPSANVGAFVTQLQHVIAAGLNISHASLSGDLSQVNYSSIRAGMLQERDSWRGLHQWIIEALCEPVYTAWRESAWVAGHIPVRIIPGLHMDHRWQPRGWAWVDPLRDVQAAALSIAHGFTSPQRVVAEDGDDFAEILAELGKANEMADKAGVTLYVPMGVTENEQANDDPAGTADAGADAGDGSTGRGRSADSRLALLRRAR